VIDSIAFHFRHFQVGSDTNRSQVLLQMFQTLSSMAQKYNLAVVMINQMTTKVNNSAIDSATLVPALGESWAHAATNRIQLYWEFGTRMAHLFKSPSRQNAKAPFTITECGVRDFDPNGIIPNKRQKIV